MPAIETTLRLRWEVEANSYMGFATIDDLRVGDTYIAPNIDRQRYLDNAWMEIEAILGELYEVPIGRDVPEASRTLLVTLHSMLATSWLLLENNGTNEFGHWLRSEFDRRIQMVIAGQLRLDGISRRPDLDTIDTGTGLSRSIPTIYVKDAASPFDSFEQFAHASTSSPWSPGAGFGARPVR